MTREVGSHRLRLTATSHREERPGGSRLSCGSTRYRIDVRAQVGEGPTFRVAVLYRDTGPERAELEEVLAQQRWESSDPQRLTLVSAEPPQTFHLLAAGGPGFRGPPEGAAEEVVRRSLASGGCTDRATRRELLRAVSHSGNAPLLEALARTCGADDKALAAVEECRRSLRFDVERGLPRSLAGSCSGELLTLEVCLAARGSPCHEAAFEYVLEKCDPNGCYEVAMASDFADAEQARQLRRRCGSCVRDR